MKFLPWKDDDWLSKHGGLLTFDKLEHFLLALVGMVLLIELFKIPQWWAVIAGFVAGALWEIKDGILPYNGAGDIEGFSWKDLIADVAGICAGLVIVIII
jgi:hypothetical protein